MGTIKVKQSPNGSEYLETIPSIQLNQNFQQSLQDAFSKINDNFKKIISLPFLQGDHGNSIFEVEMRIGEGQDGAELKKAICQCIYGTDTPNDSQFGGNYFGGSWSDGTHTYDGTPIVFYRHKETDEQNDTYFYTAREFFLFIDRRVANLQAANPSDPALASAITDFRDLSCAVTIFAQAKADPATGQPDLNDITFEAKLHTIVPTLYYDKYSKYWCWSVNGTKTGVIAQGVKGDAGASREIYVCIGHKGSVPAVQEDNGTLIVDRVMQPEAYRNFTATEFAQHVNTGDLLVVWFKDEGSPNNFWSTLDNCTFGTAKRHIEYNDQGQVANGYAYIDIGTAAGNRMDLATIMAETSLYRWLNDICSDEASLTDTSVNPAIRGLYIPNGKPFEGSKIHMLWSEIDASSPTASLGCVKSVARELMGGETLPSINGDTVTGWDSYDTSALNLWYPTIRCHRGAFYRLMDNYAMSSGITPANLSDQSLRSFGDPSVMPSTYNLGRTDGKIASAFSLKGPDTDAVKDETIVASTGIIIKRSENQDNPNDVPSVYIDHGKYGNIYVRGGKITAEGARLYIGRKNGDNTWYDPKTYFDAKYDGSDTAGNGDGGSYTSAVEEEIKTKRWEFGEPTDGSTAYMRNPGMKLVSSDIVDHGGMIIVSSDNAYKSVFIKDNKVMFDYKVHAEIGGLSGTPTGSTKQVDNATAVHDRRPRGTDYLGIQLGGYCTVYNTITGNSDANGAVSQQNGVLTDPREPIRLTPAKNKELAFMSGKSGFSAMIENWDGLFEKTRKVDGNYRIVGNYQQSTDSNSNWGLVTSYDCIWTKVGNVVDVRGKIMFNKAKYSNNNGGVSVNISTAQPISYAEFFRFMKRYGSQESFPLPIVIDKSTAQKRHFAVSVGNMLDNAGNNNIVNSAAIVGSSGDYMPFRTQDSSSIYHNNIYNGSAQFHFYGSKEDDVQYMGSGIDEGLTTALGPSDSQSFDMLNNVFTVTADISKSPTYDDRYWTFSALPNYDSINCHGSLTAQSSWGNQVKLNDSANGPLRIVRYETDPSSRSNESDWDGDGIKVYPFSNPDYKMLGGAFATSAKYNYTQGILGIDGLPNINFSNQTSSNTFKSRKPAINYHAAGCPNGSVPQNPQTPDGYGDITQEHLVDWLFTQYVNNLREYKISVNIGAYLIRYVTFGFSYILDDDIQQQYQASGSVMVPAGYNSGADTDQWVLPGDQRLYAVRDNGQTTIAASSVNEHANAAQ